MTDTTPPASSYETAPFPELTLGQLRAIVARHRLDLGDVGDDEIERLTSTGVINSIWALGPRWVLRVPKMVDEGVSDTRTESVAVPVAHAAGVRTPALVVFDDSGEIVDGLYTIYERVHGVTLDVAASPVVLRDLGAQLARLHRDVTSCPDPKGWLDDAGRYEDASSLLEEAPPEVRWLEEVLARLQPAITTTTVRELRRFVHNDVQPTNVLVTAANEAVLIDWGDAGWGDPVEDFRNLPPQWLPTALTGYRSVMPVDDDDTAEQRIMWDQACRALYYAHHRPQYVAELRAFAEEDPALWSAWTTPGAGR